ncbi:hypothetical protein AV645_12855 [Acinetobacter calcoaceticus]|uniref:hypothetical protein n=1 Tax=Acinetobacter calcoaceticus TaxID=471 RepID=UPI00074AFF33|nr:hypothetical protein [Acinetobacter calcoaceticus]KUM13745.1 hypothetical protein AV645_12855 [Acinetobacter calcoaceticus]
MEIYKLRTTQILNITNFDDLESLDDQQVINLIIKFGLNHREITFDVGSWCFSEVDKKSRINKIKPVKLDSLKKDRILPIKKIILKFVEESQSNNTLKGQLKNFNYIINYINENYGNADVSNVEDALEIYKNFTIFLLDKIKQFTKGGNTSDFGGYSLKQKLLRIFLEFSTNLTSEYFLSSIKRIKSDRINRPITQYNSEDVNIFLEKQIYIFETLARYILNKEPLPYIVDLIKFGGEKYFFEFNKSKKINLIKDDMFYDEDNKIVPINIFLDKVVKDKRFIESNSSITQLKASYYFKVKSLKDLNLMNFRNCNIKVNLANIAIMAFAKAFIAVTGVNEAVLCELKVEKFEMLSSKKGMRGYGSKIRAGGKTVPIEFVCKFLKFYKLFLDFRSYLLSEFDKDTKNGIDDKLFFYMPTMTLSKINKFTKLDNVYFTKYHRFLKDVFQIVPVHNRILRKNVSNNYLAISNDPLLTAEKLGNTPKTILKNYTNISFEEMALQMSEFYKAQIESTVLRYRFNSEIIGVNIKNSQEKNKQKSTPIGHCEERNPALKKEFNDNSIQPNCSNLETCLFCDKYAIHADVVDIKKIISVKMIIANLKNKTKESEQIIYRINEILKFMTNKFPTTSLIIKKTEENVEEGFLDDFWLQHLQLLVSLEEI